MAKVVWPKKPQKIEEIDKRYVSSLSVNQEMLAIVAPSTRDFEGQVYVLDAASGDMKLKLLAGWSPHSVAVTEDGRLLVARGYEYWQTSEIKPEVGLITSLEDGLEKPQKSFTVNEKEIPWHKKVLFGNIALIPGMNQALIPGVSDNYAVKGFVLLADWSTGAGGLSMFSTEIEEAAHDIAIVDQCVYIATGRGGTIDIFSFPKGERIRQLMPRGVSPFKPMRVVVSGRYVVAASYNELFWWEDNVFVGAEALGEPTDCINGLATLRSGGIICALTYSNRLLLKHLPNVPARVIKIEAEKPLDRPCWVVADPKVDGRIYVMGHSNGMIWAIDV